jgi:serine/threonine-protein kinase RIO1
LSVWDRKECAALPSLILQNSDSPNPIRVDENRLIPECLMEKDGSISFLLLEK